jgi:aryl-alcohol dehydrogenase-like predicted oxidoreductase
MDACDESLKRMQTDFIDLYQFHHVDRSAPWEEVWQACETLVRQGKVLYYGSSNFAGWQIAGANEAAKSRHFMGLVCEQSRYNLTVRQPELEVIPACRHYGLGFIPWSPLAGGILGGGMKRIKDGRRAGAKKEYLRYAKQIGAYDRFCSRLGEKPADVALAWMLMNPVVTAPIIGPRTMQQLDGSLRSLKIKLDKKKLAELDVIFPGPGGEAPEAYAW